MGITYRVEFAEFPKTSVLSVFTFSFPNLEQIDMVAERTETVILEVASVLGNIVFITSRGKKRRDLVQNYRKNGKLHKTGGGNIDTSGNSCRHKNSSAKHRASDRLRDLYPLFAWYTLTERFS